MSKIEGIVALIDTMDQDERRELFEEIMHKYCIYCGGPNPQFGSCNCEKDE